MGIKERGAYYTPPRLAQAIAEWAIRSPRDRVLDPACGDGVFLTQASTAERVGVEIDPTAAQRALSTGARIIVGDFFKNWQTLGTFDSVMGNPPFIRLQCFSGEHKERALAAAAHAGVNLSRESSTWAPFVAVASALVRPGGRLGMVIPREALFVRYAKPLLAALARRFARVCIVTLDGYWFNALERIALLLCEGTGAGVLTVSHQRDIQNLSVLFDEPAPEEPEIPAGFVPLSEFATLKIGIVTGGFDFFVMRPSDCIPSAVRPIITSPHQIEGCRFTDEDLRRLRSKDEPCLLFAPNHVTPRVRSYLHEGEKREVHVRYKCRVRDPWWKVKLGESADALLGYLIKRRPRFASNDVRILSTNNVHRLWWKRPFEPAAFYNAATLLSIEQLGRIYGGGVLKIEPTDVRRILVPERTRASRHATAAVDRCLRENDLRGALVAAGELAGLSPRQTRRYRAEFERLRDARLTRVVKAS